MDSKALSSNIAAFAAKFVNELQKDSNVVSSPLSAEFVLALLALGSTATAHDELLSALGVLNDEAIRQSFTTVSSKIKSIKGVTLNVANRVYVMEGPYELVAKLKQDAVQVFNAAIEQCNFADNVNAAQKINQWVEDQTNHKIKDLLSPDSFNEDTRLVLVNALYFKGSWKQKFNPVMTTDKPFHLNANKIIQVPMMFQESKFNFGVSEALDATLLEMPYQGEESSMVIVLPNQIEGLNGVMEKLAAGHNLMADLDQMFKTSVLVTLPKFKIETEIDLMTVLPKLGIKSIFSARDSGLDNMLSPPQPLYVSKAVQKAFIEVNEEGAEAAAATGMVMMMRCMPAPSQRFLADRPFLYILTGAQRSTLFIGVFRDRSN